MSGRADTLTLEGWRAEGQALELAYKIDSYAFVERFTFPPEIDLTGSAPRLGPLFDLLETLAGVSYYKAFMPSVVEGVPEAFAEIARGVREFADDSRFTIVADRAEAIQFAVDLARTGDVVAAFGKGHERSMCFGETEYPWSDQEAMIGALGRRFVKGE